MADTENHNFHTSTTFALNSSPQTIVRKENRINLRAKSSHPPSLEMVNNYNKGWKTINYKVDAKDT